ncbi:MAG: hypothetical protein K6E24_03965 [bacterium]|nr:hypothetical protein [bacterium]
MALQLKNKVNKEKKDETVKSGKYKRKRNVFGKRLFRFGLVGTIIGLVLVFTVVKVTFTLSQNKKQKKIDADLVAVRQQIKKYKNQINKKAESYENVGELVATLPLSFDRQATSLDLDRMVILSGLTESTTATRKMTQTSAMPFKCSVSSVKAVQITMTLYGKNDDINSVLKFINYLTDYNHENFYYIETLSYSEDRGVYARSVTNIKMYTFYNDIELTPTTQTTTTTK